MANNYYDQVIKKLTQDNLYIKTQYKEAIEKISELLQEIENIKGENKK